MRYPVPENKKIYIRFHKEIDKMIEAEAKKRGIKRATLVARIFSSYVFSPFPFSPLSSSFFIKRGRGREKKIGRGMVITVKKVVDNEIRIRAEREGMKEKHFRTSIIYTFINNERNCE